MQVLTTAPSSPFPTGALNSWMEMSDQRRTAQRRMRSAINELRGSCLRAGWYRWSLRIHSSRRHRGLFARLRHRGLLSPPSRPDDT